jgi:hypothetical protein
MIRKARGPDPQVREGRGLPAKDQHCLARQSFVKALDQSTPRLHAELAQGKGRSGGELATEHLPRRSIRDLIESHDGGTEQ